MKKRVLPRIAVLVVLSVSIVASCSKDTITGSGNIVEEQRAVGGFDEIHVSGIGTLVVEMGDEEQLRVKADDNLLPHIKSDVKDEKLTINIERGFTLDPAEPIFYYVTAKELETIAFAGSGSFKTGKLNAENFSLKLAGAVRGQIEELSSESLSVEISGSGDAKIGTLRAESLDVSISGSGITSIENGDIEKQKINIAGSGKYEAGNLQSVLAEVNLAGSGSVALSAGDHLKVSIAGSGSVEYTGNPGLDTSIMGTGTVKWIGQRAAAEK